MMKIFYEELKEEFGAFGIFLFVLVIVVVLLTVITIPYTMISKNSTENAYIESVIADNNGEYTFTETEKWETCVLVDEYSRNAIMQPVIIGKIISMRRIPERYSLTVTYEDITKEIDVDEEIWEKYHTMIGEEIPVLVYKKYLNDELIRTELKEIQ